MQDKTRTTAGATEGRTQKESERSTALCINRAERSVIMIGFALNRLRQAFFRALFPLSRLTPRRRRRRRLPDRKRAYVQEKEQREEKEKFSR